MLRSSMRLSIIQAASCTVALVLLLAGCAPGGATSSGTAPLRVLTTTTVFADIVRNVGGDRVQVESIIPAGIGPEDYEPAPGDAKKLADADLIVSNGVGLDDFLDRLIEAAGQGHAARLVLGDGIPTIKVGGESNPHFWLDPSLVVQYYLPAIEAKLSALDPADATTFVQREGAYAAEVSAMDAGARVELDTIPVADRKLVTAHDAFPYFAAHYGFTLIGVILENVGQEPTAADMAALVGTVKAAHVHAIFSESQFNPALANALATEAGITEVVTTLYNDTLGPPPADTYLGMMRWNIEHIVQALK